MIWRRPRRPKVHLLQDKGESQRPHAGRRGAHTGRRGSRHWGRGRDVQSLQVPKSTAESSRSRGSGEMGSEKGVHGAVWGSESGNRGQFGSSEELPIRMNMDPREQPLVQECSEFVPENRDFSPGRTFHQRANSS